MSHVVAALSLSIAASACSNEPVGRDADAVDFDRSASSALVDYGILNLVNDPTTDEAFLDLVVPLDARSAFEIIAHRNGEDGLPGTADDNTFDHIRELDEVYWVGPVAMSLLESYVIDNDLVPHADDLLGTYDGVELTYGEAIDTLALANTATEDELDYDVPLDRRAVDSILDARPIESMEELAELYWVGPVGMNRMVQYALPTPPANSWSEQFSHDQQFQIPDGWGGLWTQVEVVGAPAEADVLVVEIDVEHDDLSQVKAKLTAPNGSYMYLWVHEASPETIIDLPPEFQYGDDANGTWSLTLWDTVAGTQGSLQGWSMTVSTPGA
ncbi:MAG: proprotein convertase P-domain-containing protein [Myxococcota bacterium]